MRHSAVEFSGNRWEKVDIVNRVTCDASVRIGAFIMRIIYKTHREARGQGTSDAIQRLFFFQRNGNGFTFCVQTFVLQNLFPVVSFFMPRSIAIETDASLRFAVKILMLRNSHVHFLIWIRNILLWMPNDDISSRMSNQCKISDFKF